MKKLALAAAIGAALGVSTPALADRISFSFTGLLTMADKNGQPQLNGDMNSNQDYGFRTNISGTGVLDTYDGSGRLTISPFSFFGSGLSALTEVTLQAIGDGAGGPGTLMTSAMYYNWSGTTNIPVTAVFDASGFFNSIGRSGPTWSVGSNCSACATSATADWTFGPFSGSIGAVPIAMTTFNTAGTTIDTSDPTLGGVFPLSTDGVSGSPMTTSPFPGFNMNLDITQINATYVPVPPALWLFGSGLAGLIGIARRRRPAA